MKYFILFSRLTLGFVLLLFGANGLLNLYPLPETTPEATAFLTALWDSGYLMYVAKVIETAVGLCLLFNRFLPLAALILLPVSVNIMMVDVLLQPQFWYVGASVFLLNLALLVYNRKVYTPILASM